MGRGDQRSKKGKRNRASYGNSRKKKPGKPKPRKTTTPPRGR